MPSSNRTACTLMRLGGFSPPRLQIASLIVRSILTLSESVFRCLVRYVRTSCIARLLRFHLGTFLAHRNGIVYICSFSIMIIDYSWGLILDVVPSPVASLRMRRHLPVRLHNRPDRNASVLIIRFCKQFLLSFRLFTHAITSSSLQILHSLFMFHNRSRCQM